MKLKDVGDYFIGLTYKPDDVSDSGIIVLRSGNIQNKKICMDDIVRVNKKIPQKLFVQPGDILMCSRNGSAHLVGKSAVIPHLTEDMTFGAFMTIFRTPINDYLQHFFSAHAFRRQLAAGKTTTINQITISMLDNIEIDIPASVIMYDRCKKLNAITSIIDQRKKQLTALDTLIKARFVEMFGNPVTNPHGYLVQTLQQLIDSGFITYHLDGNHGGDYPRSEEFVESGVPYIGANCIVNGEINFSMAKYLTEEKAGKLRKGIARDGDVLFAHNATVGPTVVLHTNMPKVILSTSLTAYRCNQNRIKPNYLKAYMQSDGFIRQYSEEMKQTTRNQVPITAQKKYLFLVPPLEDQEKFAIFVDRIDKSKAVVQRTLVQNQLLFDSLMQKYFG